jgi:hypothetical protein
MERNVSRDAAARAEPRSLEHFVRSLVGVEDVEIVTNANGHVERVRVVPAAGASERQVRLNVISALMAGPGIALDPAALRIVSPLPGPALPVGTFSQETTTEPHAEDGFRTETAPPPAHGRARNGAGEPAVANGHGPTNGNGRVNGNGHANGRSHANGNGANGNGHASRPRLVLHAAMVEPLEGGRMRCRVELVAGEQTFMGVREDADRPGARVELAARVAADAIRAARGAAPPVQLAGVTVTEVAGRPHVVAAMSVWTGSEFSARPGVAAVEGSWEDAAVRAVLSALED